MKPGGIILSEETGENLAEVKASLEMVFNNIRTLKREVLYVNQKFSNLDSTIQAFEEFSSKFNETEKELGELKTSMQEIQMIKQTMSELQQSLNEQTTKQKDLLNPLNEAMTNVQSKLSTFDQDLSKITTVEENIGKLKETFQDLKESHSHQESKLAEIQTNFNNISPSFDALKSNYEKNSDSIQKLEEGFIEYKTTIEEKLNQLMNDSLGKFINEFETKVDGLNTRIANLENSIDETTTKMASGLEEINTNMANFVTQIEEASTNTSGFLNRIQNLEEKAGISTGELIGTGFDNLGMLRQLVTDLLSEEKANQHLPREMSQDPSLVIRGLKGIIRDLSFIDDSNSLNTSEILLKYSETSGDRADRRTLIVNFNKDIQRVLEIGQSVLMDIGQKRMQTRNIIEEIRNLARQWTSEDDVRGESGVFMALDLLETLEKEF